MLRLRNERTWRLLALFWTITLVVGLSLPRGVVPDLGLLSFDKVIHAAIFALFAGLWMKAGSGRWLPRAAWVFGVAVVLAVFTEWLQGALAAGRTPDVYDALADVLGAAATLILHGLWYAMRSRQPAAAGEA